MTTEQCINRKVYRILELLKSGAAAGLLKKAEVVDELPEPSKDTMRILYLVPSTTPGQEGTRDEYITVETDGIYTWEKLGVNVDLSEYAELDDLVFEKGSGENSIQQKGTGATASGTGSHAEGSSTTASSDYSHAEGYNTTASGYYSHAEGSSTKANGTRSHAEGDRTTAQNFAEHAEGTLNKSNKASTTYGNAGNTIHSVGIGTSDNNRKNAFEIMQNGDIYVVGLGGYDGTNANAATTLQDLIGDIETLLAAI